MVSGQAGRQRERSVTVEWPQSEWAVYAAHCALGGDRYTTPAQVSRPYPGHSKPAIIRCVLAQTGAFMLAYITSAAAATILTAADR